VNVSSTNTGSDLAERESGVNPLHENNRGDKYQSVELWFGLLMLRVVVLDWPVLRLDKVAERFYVDSSGQNHKEFQDEIDCRRLARCGTTVLEPKRKSGSGHCLGVARDREPY
jgi:hypothetical protein